MKFESSGSLKKGVVLFPPLSQMYGVDKSMFCGRRPHTYVRIYLSDKITSSYEAAWFFFSYYFQFCNVYNLTDRCYVGSPFRGTQMSKCEWHMFLFNYEVYFSFLRPFLNFHKF